MGHEYASASVIGEKQNWSLHRCPLGQFGAVPAAGKQRQYVLPVKWYIHAYSGYPPDIQASWSVRAAGLRQLFSQLKQPRLRQQFERNGERAFQQNPA